MPAPMWKEFMTEVVKDLPILEWPIDPSDIEKYYEIPTIEIPQLIGLNILDAEEIAFSSYILPTINLVESEEAPGLVLSQDLENGEEFPEGTEVVLEVSGNKFSAAIPSITPCTLTPDEGEDLIRDFMRENNVILFIKEEYEENDLENCDGKIIGTNVSQGAVMTTGDTLVFVISNLKEES